MPPAIVAQASATLAAMYPGRHCSVSAAARRSTRRRRRLLAETPERIKPDFEAIELIKKLFGSRGKDVKHDGKFFKLEPTRLWTMPDEAPPIFIATAGPVTAKRTGQYAEGLITVGAPESKLEMIREKCEEGCRESARIQPTFRYILRLHLSWAPTDEQAMANAMTEWPNGGMKFPKQDIRSPLDFEQMAKIVPARGLRGRMLDLVGPGQAPRPDPALPRFGFDQVYLHNVGRNRPSGSRPSPRGPAEAHG